MEKPQHVAIIMDGNRRWAVEKGLPKVAGYTYGADLIGSIARAAIRQDIPYLTLFTLSTENLKKRNPAEIGTVISLLETIEDRHELFRENKVRFRTIGDLSLLPESAQEALAGLRERTAGNTALTVTIAVGYGGRDEIVRAAKKAIADALDDLTEESFGAYLDTKDLPDVDLVIRTAGDRRLSGFMTWQSVYAELYFTDTKWPAFTEGEFDRAIEWFGEQQRNRGK